MILVTSTEQVILWFVRRKGPSFISTKFEADCSIRSKVIKGSQNFEVGSRDPGHTHLGVFLWLELGFALGLGLGLGREPTQGGSVF